MQAQFSHLTHTKIAMNIIKYHAYRVQTIEVEDALYCKFKYMTLYMAISEK